MAQPPLLVLTIESHGALDEIGHRLDAGPLGVRDWPGRTVPGRALGCLQPHQQRPTAIGKSIEPLEASRLKGVGLLLEQVEDGKTRLVIGVEGGLERGGGGLHGAEVPDPLALRASASDFSTEMRSDAMFWSSWSEGEFVGSPGWSLRVRMSE